MNKYEALICTGKLEILLQDQEQMLKVIHQLQSYIAENDIVNTAIYCGKLDELCKHSRLSEEVYQNLKNLSKFVTTENGTIPNTNLEEKVLNTEIIDLKLSVRTYNYLMRAGVRTIGDYLNLDPNEKQKMAGKNKKIIPEVDEKISHFWVEI